MDYVALVGGQERHVEITSVAPDRYHIILDGHRWEVDARELATGTLSLLMDERVYAVELEHVDAHVYNVLVQGHAVQGEVLDLRRMRLRRAQESQLRQEGPVVLKAPMPGKVVEVLVQEGEQVQKGQSLLVMEAMKMENEVKAPQDGTVKSISVSAGGLLEHGTVLCVIE